MAISDYRPPGVEVDQTFEDVTPTPAATAFLPAAVGPSFEILDQEVVGDAENNTGYPTQSTFPVPVRDDSIIDEQSIDVFIRNDQYGTILLDDSHYTFDSANDEITLEPASNIQIDTTGDGSPDTAIDSVSGDPVFDVLLSVEAIKQSIDSDGNSEEFFVVASTPDEIRDDVGSIVPENPLAWGMFWSLTSTDTVVTGQLVTPEVNDDVLQPELTVTVTGSSANDGDYDVSFASAPTYDSGADTTTFTLLDSVDDSTADGTLEVQDHNYTISAVDTTNDTITVDGDATQDVDDAKFDHYMDKANWNQALARLETRDVYNVVPNFPNDRYFNEALVPSLIDDFLTHAETMSKPENKNERITTFVNPAFDESITDKRQQAEELRDFADSYNSRRLTLVVPDTAEVPVDGSLEIVDGQVICNIIAGMDAFHSPSQPFTNLPMSGGVNRLFGSNDFFRDELLDTIASGGNYIVTQDGEGTAPTSRHQQTTHTDLIEKNERSIIKSVDYSARAFRAQLEKFVGRYNITEDILSTIRTGIQGTVEDLKENDVIEDAQIITLEQKENEEDEIRLKIRLAVLYPNNNIDVEVIV